MEERYQLVFKKGGKFFQFATLKFDLDKRELIYIPEYSFPKKSFARYKDYETGLVETWRCMDHVSFHRDGTAHVVIKNLKGEKRRLDPKKAPGNPFEVPATSYLPVLLHTIVQKELFTITKEIKTPDKSALVFDGEKYGSFSLVLFSVGVNVNWMSLLGKFRDVFDLEESKFLVEPLIVHEEADVARIGKGIFLEPGLLLGFTGRVVTLPEEMLEDAVKRKEKIPSYYDFRVYPGEDGINKLT